MKVRKRVVQQEGYNTKTKQSAFFKERIYFSGEIYSGECFLEKEQVDYWKSTPFFKKGMILISNI